MAATEVSLTGRRMGWIRADGQQRRVRLGQVRMDGTLLYFDTLTVVQPPPTPTPSLQVSSGTLGPQRNTQQEVTFTVGPDGVAVTRKFETREAGAQTWSDHVQTNPRTDPTHTLTATGLAAGTTYDWRATFTASGYDAVVVEGTFTTLAPVTVPSNALSWSPPTLVEARPVWNVSATNRTLVTTSDRDIRMVWPSTPLDIKGGLELTGGRNVVSIGGEYKVDTPLVPAGVQRHQRCADPAGAALTNRFLKISGVANTAPRTIHIEGLKVHGAELFEGINFKANRDTRVTMRRQNVWVGRLRAFVPNPVNGGQHDGGDWDQPIEDPYIYQIDREWLSEQDYQALFLQPTAFGDAGRTLGTWDFRRLQIIGSDGTRAQLLAMNGSEPPPERRLLTDVWVQPSAGQTNAQAIKGVWNGVNYGTSPVQFVDPAAVGIAYVSPGYA